MKILLHVFVTAGALLLAAYVVPGIVVADVYTALVAAIVVGLLNLIVRPILFILTLPITLLTFGLFVFVINAMMFGFASYFVEGFVVEGFVPALVGSLVVSVVSAITDRFIS